MNWGDAGGMPVIRNERPESSHHLGMSGKVDLRVERKQWKAGVSASGQ